MSTAEPKAPEAPAYSVYDYFVMMTGMKPPMNLIQDFSKVKINTNQGKMCKVIVDSAMAFMENLHSNNDDRIIVEIAAKNIHHHLSRAVS